MKFHINKEMDMNVPSRDYKTGPGAWFALTFATVFRSGISGGKSDKTF